MKRIDKGLLRIWMLLSIIWVIYAVYAYAWEPLAKLNIACNPYNPPRGEFEEGARIGDDGSISYALGGRTVAEVAQYYSDLGCSVNKVHI